MTYFIAIFAIVAIVAIVNDAIIFIRHHVI